MCETPPKWLTYPIAMSWWLPQGATERFAFFDAGSLAPQGSVSLGDDADNVRVDPRTGDVLVGFGTSQIAIIDPAKRELLSNVPLPSHPESFRLSSSPGRLFVNVPTAGKIVMVDDLSRGTGASCKTRGLTGNFPMVLDEVNRAIIVVFRTPAKLATFDMMTGKEIGTADACGDSDDVFLDEKRKIASMPAAGRAGLMCSSAAPKISIW
jgi:hypothetical protein